MEHTTSRRLHVARATDWMDAVISILEPRSPYRPWRYGSDDAQRHATLMDLTTVATLVGLTAGIADRWWFDGDGAGKLDTVLDDCRYIAAPASRFGHTSVAAARTLLRFWGRCDGCEQAIDLTGPNARDRLFVHTIDPYGRGVPADSWSVPADWPAVMCRTCADRMVDERFASFVDFKFSLHPACPACGARRARATFYGMPSDHSNIEPWSHAGGCCVEPEKWCCSECGHQW